MTREEFTKEYCKEMDKSEVIECLANEVVLPCNCDYEKCKGWQMVSLSKFWLRRIKKLIETGESC